MQDGSGKKVARAEPAFLISDDGRTFTVMTPELISHTYTRTPPSAPRYEKVDYRPVDLKAIGEGWLKAMRGPQPTGAEALWARFGEYLSEPAEAFVIARACDANGMPELGRDLFAAAAGLPVRGQPATRPINDRLADDIASGLMWQYVKQFGDVKTSRGELLERFRSFALHFPNSEYVGQARDTADMLARMVAEDRVHAATSQPMAQMTPHDRIAELIFELRDQNGEQWSQPGACDIFEDPRGKASPASQLVALGFDAVPQLIDALTDDRFTRSVGYHRDFYFSHHVLRIGDCALAIIERIAGRSFYRRATTNSEMMKDGETAATKKAIQAWWGQIQSKGERQVLIDATEVGDENSPLQAERLIAKYPDAALDAIVAGAGRATNMYVHTDLISATAGIKGDSPIGFLLSEMKRGTSLRVRVEAMDELAARNRPEALPAMIAEWRKCSGGEGEDGPGNLIISLASANSPDAIEALGEKLLERPVELRVEIGQALMMPREGRVDPQDSHSPLRTFDKPALDAVESLLVEMLSDKAHRYGESGTWEGYAMTDPRVCDMAGVALAVRFKDRYTFDTGVSLVRRDRQCLAMQNQWRTARHLPPLPEPETRAVASVPSEPLNAALDRVVATEAGKNGNSIAQVEDMGIGALAGVNERLARLPVNAAARPELESLAKRLSCVVDEIDITPTNAVLPAKLRGEIEGFRNKTLTAEALTEMLVTYAASPPAEFSGILVSAVRNEDYTGVCLRVEFTPGVAKSTNDTWETNQSVILGAQALTSLSGGIAMGTNALPRDYSSLSRAVSEAVAAPPDASFEISASVRSN
jgi:hypothetical protein